MLGKSEGGVHDRKNGGELEERMFGAWPRKKPLTLIRCSGCGLSQQHKTFRSGDLIIFMVLTKGFRSKMVNSTRHVSKENNFNV